MELALDASGDAQPSLAHDVFVLARRASRMTIPIVPQRRGILRVDALWLRWRGPLGLVEQRRTFPLDRSAKIFPSIHASRTAAFELFTRDAVLGLKVQLQSGEGSEFEALREYAPGHDIRFVDWKHSARHRKLLSKEFRTERNHPVVLAFDTGHLMREPVDQLARLDHSINSGLLLAWLALRSGDLVGTYSFDARPGRFVNPARGMSRFRYLQQVSADFAYSADETNFTLGLDQFVRAARPANARRALHRLRRHGHRRSCSSRTRSGSRGGISSCSSRCGMRCSPTPWRPGPTASGRSGAR